MISNTLADYNLWLVGLSCLVAFIGAYAGLALTRYMVDIDGEIHPGWLCLAGLVLSTAAIWATHFVGMLAYDPGVAISYDVGLTALSLLAPLPMTLLGLYVVSRWRNSVMGLVGAGTLMGLGIAAMHYTGMAAMRIEAVIDYDPLLLAVSIAIAVGIATIGLRLAIRARRRSPWASSLIMGAGVTAMHYTGMAAMELQAVQANVAYFEGALTREASGFAAGVAIVAGVLIAAMAVLGRDLANVIADRDQTSGYS